MSTALAVSIVGVVLSIAGALVGLLALHRNSTVIAGVALTLCGAGAAVLISTTAVTYHA